MEKLAVSDIYGKKTESEVIIGGDVIKRLTERDDLNLVYFSTRSGSYTLDHGIKNKQYFKEGFVTKVIVAPKVSSFDLDEMNGFLDSLVNDKAICKEKELISKEGFRTYGKDRGDMDLQCGKLWVFKPIAEYNITARCLDNEVAKILSAKDNKIFEEGVISNKFHIYTFPDLDVAKRVVLSDYYGNLKVDFVNKKYKTGRE